MVLGLMQPYFFPYLGYFDLMARVDRWVVFDTAQYVQQGWMNRNRILHPTDGWQFVTVPVRRHHLGTPICDVRVAEDGDWRRRIEAQCQHYRRRAPHFDSVVTLLRDCLESPAPSLASLNVAILKKVCAWLGLRTEWQLLSEMGLKLEPIDEPGDWSLRLAESLQAAEYVNAPGGSRLYSAEKFAASGIRLTILSPLAFTYPCPGYRFEPSLSILDVLMWNSPEQVRAALTECRPPGEPARAQ